MDPKPEEFIPNIDKMLNLCSNNIDIRHRLKWMSYTTDKLDTGRQYINYLQLLNKT